MKGALLVAGTTSDAGKSVLTAGLCRWLARQGMRVAPFKAQNMSLNSMVTADGAEIGRAQVMQAAAARVEPTADMNPVLLKPGSDRRSQVVVLGRPVAEVDALGYGEHRARLRQVVTASLARLRAEYDVVICEGAGSPAEINLRRGDLANMGLARAAGLPVIVVGDIDRGGVFAALYGTVGLLEPEDQRLVAGFVINKFRGAPELLAPGLTQITALTGRDVYGVLPWLEGLGLDVEDSLALDGRRTAPRAGEGTLRVAVVRLPRISNFTDVDALAAEPGVIVSYATTPGELADADLIVLPGSRATVSDLGWLHERGLATEIVRRARAGRPVLGICGGYQMLAREILDDVESCAGAVAGLALLAGARGVRPGQDVAPPGRLGVRRAGGGVRDPPRDRRRGGRRSVPRRMPRGLRVGDDLARGAGEQRVPPGVPRRRRPYGGARLHARAGHRLRRAARGPTRCPRRPRRTPSRHRGADQAHRVGRPVGPADRPSRRRGSLERAGS